MEAHALDLGPVVAIVGVAVAFVALSARLGLGTVLGYLAAGVVVGPAGLSLIREVEQVQHIAEIGVVLLLFVIGLELQPRRIRSMTVDAFGLGGAQMALTAALAAAALWLLGLPPAGAGAVGFALALSSTALALQLAAERRELGSQHGRKAFAVLLFQDIAVIPAIVLLSLTAAGEVHLAPMLAGLAGAAVLIPFGRRLLSVFLRGIAAARSRELFTAGTLFAVLAIAYAMGASGLSMGLGAFLAGITLSQSEFRHELEIVIDPFKGVLMGLFFLAVGMSISPQVLLADWMACLAGIAVLVAGKFAVLYGLGRIFGTTRGGALKFAGLLSQGGEFAFVLLAQVTAAGLVEPDTTALVTLAVIGSMVTTPLLLPAVDRLAAWLAGRERGDTEPGTLHEAPDVIIAGFGRFGQIIARVLATQNIAFTALDRNASQVDFVRRFGNEIFFGDATRLDLLRQADAGHAKVLAIAIDDVEDSLKLAALAREAFPHLRIVARARNRFHAYRLLDAGVEHVFRETYGSSLEATQRVLRELGLSPSNARRATRIFRRHDEEMMRRAAPHHEDMEQLIRLAREGRRELQSLFEQDRREQG